MTQPDTIQPLPEDWDRALAVVAHPDDLEYGSASAIARWTSQGKTVIYVMASAGEAGMDSMPPEECARLRKREEISGARVVGVDTVEFLGYQDGVMEYGLPLRKDISRMIRKHRPDVLITGNYELTRRGVTLNMADHRWVGLAALDAARDAANRWIFPELLDEGYEPWNGIRRVFISGASEPTHFVDTTEFMDKGVASLEEHRAYLDNLDPRPDPNEFLRKRAAEIGERFGCGYATTFAIIGI